MAEDHKVALGQRHNRDPGIDRRINNAGSTRTETFAISQYPQFAHGRCDIKGLTLDGGQNEFTGFEQTGAGQVFLGSAHYNMVDTSGAGAARTAVSRRTAGLGLQFERDVLQNMANPGALLQATHKTAWFFITAFVFA